MARARDKRPRQPVTPADIDLRGTGEAAKRLARYAKQEGTGAWPLLEQAFDRGSAKMRTAAVRAMAALDPVRAEAVVKAAIAALPSSGTVRKREQLRDCLLLIDSPTAIVAAVAAGAHVKTEVSAATHAGVLAYLAERATAVPDQIASLLDRARRVIERDVPENRDATRTLALALLTRADARRRVEGEIVYETSRILHDGGRLLTYADGALAAFVAIEELGIELPIEMAMELWRDAPVDERVAVLGTYVGDEDARGQIARMITKQDDPAWAALLLPYIDEPDVLRAVALLGHSPTAEKLRKMASNTELDLRTRNACYLLGNIGDAEATPILLHWLAHPAGIDAAPMLLVALGACGTADAIPVLEQLREHHAGRGSFFALAIDEIRERTSPTT
jgi:hypothetical protein